MAGPSKTPTFNLKVVLNETGLKADTVRAWERRYSLPQPNRSDGGQRLYSEYDIQILKWLIARQTEGLSISRAASLWHRLTENGQDPLEHEVKARPQLEAGATSSQQRADWIAACLAFDEQSAEHILNQAFASYLPELVCFEVLQKGLSEIGDAWARGDATVSQEHFASALASRRLQTLITATPPPTRDSRILVVCPPVEEHTFSLLLVTFVLKRAGWDVLFLGANVPVDAIQIAVTETRPDLALLAAQSLPAAAALADMAAELARCSVAVTFGGRIFNMVPSLREQIQGEFLTETLEGVPDAIERLIRQGPVIAEPSPISAAYQTALDEYRTQRPLIEAEVLGDSLKVGIPYSQLISANHFLGGDVDAALRLGDIAYLDVELEWLAPILSSRHVPTEHLGWYLETYLRCAAGHLRPGHPLTTWRQTG